MAIIVTADSSCDLAVQHLDPIPFELFPLSIIQGERVYRDGLDISPEDIYERVAKGAPVPTTSAVNVADYESRFAVLSTQYEAVIHISLGSDISSCHAHACIAARHFANVHLVDSQNISVAHGLLVIAARRMLLEGCAPAAIAAELNEMAERIEFTFILDQVSYLHKGGRCSNIALLGANLLKLKPVIAMQSGKLAMVRKYRGSFEKVLPEFFRDLLKDRTDLDMEHSLLVSTHCPSHWITLARSQIVQFRSFEPKELFTAGCTICSHCGPKALGLALLRKKK